MSESICTTGRRKTAVARVTMVPGSGEITINKRPFEEFFPTISLQNQVLAPFAAVNEMKKWDLTVITNGGGVTAQVGAVRLGIARGLLAHNAEYREALRADDHLTRDARKKERKKAGQPGARKRFQFSKR